LAKIFNIGAVKKNNTMTAYQMLQEILREFITRRREAAKFFSVFCKIDLREPGFSADRKLTL